MCFPACAIAVVALTVGACSDGGATPTVTTRALGTAPPTSDPGAPAETTPEPESSTGLDPRLELAEPPPLPQGVGTRVGAQRYDVPAGALIVSPDGDDDASGSVDAPLRSLELALRRVHDGGTIVLRAGVYHESVEITRPVTLQSWPGEEVWLDGSVPVAEWVPDGNLWRLAGWTIELDSSPTYTRGAPDHEDEYRFLNPEHPLAAHPDQLFIDGVGLEQVESRDRVIPGTFFHDEPADQLFIASDPTGHDVRASALVRAIEARSEGVVLRGFGVRRYAPSVPDIAAVTLERPGILVQHVAITDSATTGISAVASDIQLQNLYVARNGMLGVHANEADGLVIDRVLSEDNNHEHFNPAPVSGGTKVTRSRGIQITNSVFRNNDGPGIWIDQSVNGATITDSQVRDNAHHGIVLEISANAVIVNSVIAGNGEFGLKINNTSNVQIWNNTVVGNDRPINVVQDDRRYGDGSAGVDPRVPQDPNMTWLVGPAVIANNIIASLTEVDCLLCVEDYSRKRSAEDMGVTANGNLYNPLTQSLGAAVLWSTGAGAENFWSLDHFRNATGQEASGDMLVGAPAVDQFGTRLLDVTTETLPLPPGIAALIGRSPDTVHVGAF